MSVVTAVCVSERGLAGQVTLIVAALSPRTCYSSDFVDAQLTSEFSLSNAQLIDGTCRDSAFLETRLWWGELGGCASLS